MRVRYAAVSAALAGLVMAGAGSVWLRAQQVALPAMEPSTVALPLPEDRGRADLEQTLKRLGTTASVLMIVAHPDDEDGALLTWLTRGLGARATLLTLTRGEGGQNAMSAETYDALGLMRTSELLKADEYYGAQQLWGTEADFGFSKTQEESFARWGHERVLYDAVLAVRQVRPQVIVATFLGGVSDGHGQHQVSGEIAQEAFKAAADPKVFPEQLKNGLEPWQPLAVYSRTPFAPITSKGVFDYATGKLAPARFHNYVTDEWITGAPSTDATIPVGNLDPLLGRSYVQIAREGWGEQKSQYGGASPALTGPATTTYHLWGVAPEAVAKPGAAGGGNDLFHNAKVNIDTSIAGLARIAGPDLPEDLRKSLRSIDDAIQQVRANCPSQSGGALAHELVPAYRQTLELRKAVAESSLGGRALESLLFELDQKIFAFQTAFKDLLGLDMIAFTTRSDGGDIFASARGGSADETPRSVTPGEKFRVRVHTAQSGRESRLIRVWLQSQSGASWKSEDLGGPVDPAAVVSDRTFGVQAAQDAEPTAPFFTRPSTEQPYYDIAKPEWRERSFAPYPLAAWAEFAFDGVPIRVGQVVQTLQHVTGPGGIYEPLVVTPAIGVRIEPEAQLLPLDGSALPVRITVRAQAAAEGTVELKLPAGWRSEPKEAQFRLKSAGDSEPLVFSVKADGAGTGAYSIQAVAHVGEMSYQAGWQSIGYAGLLPYNQYKAAELKTRKVDVKLAPGLRVGYVMGPGDLVPEAIKELGVTPHVLTKAELAAGDFSPWNVLVIGIRAYSTRPELAAAQPRLEAFVQRGGTLIVQYQSTTFPAPLPLAMGRMPERVVDEQAPVKLLDLANPLLRWPNTITSADFDGWVEERGHSFLDTWDAGYTALTETADEGQDPQRGGLLVTHQGKGTYIYVAYALYRQLPELVPGSYRLLANLLSAGKSAAH